MLVNLFGRENAVNAIYDMPGHLIRRFQQIAVAIFHGEVSEAGSDLTPVQYAALTTVAARPGIDQATLAGLIAYDRATIGGVVDRLVQKNLLAREINEKDRRAHVLLVTEDGRRLIETITPAVENAQRLMLQGLDETEKADFLRLLAKALDAVNDLSRAPLKSPPKR